MSGMMACRGRRHVSLGVSDRSATGASLSSPMILPGSWAGVLELLRPVFKRRGTFVVFTVLATGMVASTGRRLVAGMLAGARMAQQTPFHAACRFFSSAVWDIDRLELIEARLIVTRLLGSDEPITAVIDDTLFKRWGRQVHHAFLDPRRRRPGRQEDHPGNRWVIAVADARTTSDIIGCRIARHRFACRCCCGCGQAREPPPRWSWPPSWSSHVSSGDPAYRPPFLRAAIGASPGWLRPADRPIFDASACEREGRAPG
jgi:DDE superfamily endonuclease